MKDGKKEPEYAEGAAARLRGESRKANPYGANRVISDPDPSTTGKSILWDWGWSDIDKTAQNNEK